MSYLLSAGLKRIVKTGHLELVTHKGRRFTMGDPAAPKVVVRLNTAGIARRLLRDPSLALGEGYMDGEIDMLEGSIADLLELFARDIGTGDGSWPMRALRAVRFAGRRIAQLNPRARSRRNVAHHYDLSGRLYDLFLDPERQYSCAFFEKPSDSLETAQRNKMRRLAAKLALRPGDRVLDIGSGWGGLGTYFARAFGACVTGVTLSTEQLAVAQQRAADPALAGRAQFKLQDYRDVAGRFDRIVSVGMLEHVGVDHYRTYFDDVARLLADDGAAVIHTIGRSDGPGVTNPWITKYIFPGGYTPALSELLPIVEKTGLIVTDVEVLRMHYAWTLAEWRRRFMARRDEAKALYDERFCRMWEFYLAGAEMGFRYQGLVVFQLQLAKRNDALPFTRDYMTPPPRGTIAPVQPRERDSAIGG
ncbi:MAG: class I SAM-dependent methyltransferase [Alphaproteobacteria bacterium]|nr:class I SAM-dependent methyltransferase [Alphaproteobacteria bacterium]